MRVRSSITAEEQESLYERLERRLADVVLDTQPEVAARILELVHDEDASIREYGDVIGVDAQLTGRLLRLANSAFFAQRSPVTRLERALVILGVDRIKALSLGFYLSRAAQGSAERELSRRIWGLSVYRACVASSLARAAQWDLVPEAFVVGLMLDCGVPLMCSLIGEEYASFYMDARTPQGLFEQEYSSLPFTHVDVVTVLARRWRLHDVLAKPLAWHHKRPPASKPTDDVHRLHQIAHCSGTLLIVGAEDDETPQGSPVGARVWGLDRGAIGKVIQDASLEYEATAGVFSDCAESIEDLGKLAMRVHSQLTEAVDDQIEHLQQLEAGEKVERFLIAHQKLEVHADAGGDVVAYICAESGKPLIRCVLNAKQETAESLKRKLGLSDACEGELDELTTFLRSVA